MRTVERTICLRCCFMLKCPTGTYLFPLRTSLTFLTAFGFYSHSERFPLKTCGPVGFGLSLSKTVKIILLFCFFLTFLSISRRTPFPFRVSFPFFFFWVTRFYPPFSCGWNYTGRVWHRDLDPEFVFCCTCVTL